LVLFNRQLSLCQILLFLWSLVLVFIRTHLCQFCPCGMTLQSTSSVGEASSLCWIRTSSTLSLAYLWYFCPTPNNHSLIKHMAYWPGCAQTCPQISYWGASRPPLHLISLVTLLGLSQALPPWPRSTFWPHQDPHLILFSAHPKSFLICSAQFYGF
jgi:hypothetical protein